MANTIAASAASAAAAASAADASTVDSLLTEIRAEADRHKDRVETENERYSRRLAKLLERLGSLARRDEPSGDSSLVRRKRNRSSTVSARSDRSASRARAAPANDKSDDENEFDDTNEEEDNEEEHDDDIRVDRVNKVARTSEVVPANNKTPKSPRRKINLKCYAPNPTLNPSLRCLFVPKSGNNKGTLCNFERVPGRVVCAHHGRLSKNFLNSPIKRCENKLRNLPRDVALKLFENVGVENPEQVLDSELTVDVVDDVATVAPSVADGRTVMDGLTVMDGATAAYEAVSEAGTMVTVPSARRSSPLAGTHDVDQTVAMETNDTISVASRVQAVHSRVSGETTTVSSEKKRGGKGRKVSSKKTPPETAAAASSVVATTLPEQGAASVGAGVEDEPIDTTTANVAAAAAATSAPTVQRPWGIVPMAGLPDGCLYDMQDKFVLEYMGDGKYKAVMHVPDPKNPINMTELSDAHRAIASKRGFLLQDKSFVHGVIPDVSSETRTRHHRAASPSAASNATTTSLSRQVVFMSLEQAQATSSGVDQSVDNVPDSVRASATVKKSNIANKRPLSRASSSAGSASTSIELVPSQSTTSFTQAELKQHRERVERGKSSPGVLSTPGTKHGVPQGSIMTPSNEDMLPAEYGSL